MAANHYLQFTGTILSYILKVAAGYLVCLCLSRILRRPDLRFRVWLGFLLASGLYWLALLGSAMGRLLPRSVADAGPASLLSTSALITSGLGRSVLNAVAASGHWLVPVRWSQDVTIAGRTLLGAYLCVVFLLACRKTWVHVRLRRLLKLGMPPAADVAALFETMRREYGVARCELAILPGLSSPATAYWWRPRIVLPEVLPETVVPESDFSAETTGLDANPQLASIFCHELAHIRRRDYFWANVADVICGVLFFHPAVWQARKQMRLERELASDLAVVNARPEARADYADNLARFVRMRIIQGGISCGVDFAASASILGARIRNILAEPVRVPCWKKLTAAAASVALLLAFLILSPGLSVALDFSSDAFSSEVTGKPLAAAQRAVKSSSSSSSVSRHANFGAAVPTTVGVQGQRRSATYEDSLRHSRSRSYVQETPAYRLTAVSSSSQVASPNWDSPALSEPSPANRPGARPTVTDSVTRIVLTTVSGIAIHERVERNEHGGHGRAR